MTQKNVDFVMNGEKLPEALKAVKALASTEKANEYKWVGAEAVLKAETMEEALEEWSWGLEFNEDGNVESIRFDGEKSGDELELFKAIAPFVEVDSFIEMQGENGYLWRYRFDGKTCREIEPEIDWDIKQRCFNRCPNCGSPETDIKWGNKRWLSEEAYQEATCKKCGCEFREVYEYSQTIIDETEK